MTNKPSQDNRPEDKLALRADFGTVYVKRTAAGHIMRPVKAEMLLHESKDHIYKVGQKWAITYDGYKQLNKVASVSLITPQKISVDGHDCPNPMIERDEDTKAVLTANVRKMGIGYSPAGNLVVIDKTLYYNVYTYFIQSIQAKMNREEWRYNKQTKRNEKTGKLKHPNAARIGTKDDKPDEDGKWVFLPTAPPLGLWINYRDDAIKECLEEHTQRQRFGDRIAQTIVERNILKTHPGIAANRVDPDNNGIATVTVWGWRHEHGSEEMKQVMRQAEQGATQIKAEVVREVIEPEPEEEAQAVEEAAEDDTEPKAAKKKEKPLFEGDPATTDPEKE